MGLTPVEIVLYGLLAASALLLALMVLWHFARTGRHRLHQWQASRRRKPDAFLALRTENSRLKAEHAMMARKLELVMEKARALATEKEAEASRAINRAGRLAEELAAAQQRADELYARRSELEIQLQERSEKLQSTEDSLRHRRQELAEARDIAKTLRADLRESEQRIKALEQDRKDLLKQGARLERELEKQREAISTLERELAEERSRFLHEKMELQDKLTDLAAQLAEKEAELLAARTGAQAETGSTKQRASA